MQSHAGGAIAPKLSFLFHIGARLHHPQHVYRLRNSHKLLRRRGRVIAQYPQISSFSAKIFLKVEVQILQG